MSLKSQIEEAKDAVSKALITALENKDEYVISSLFTCYNTLNNLKTKESFKIEVGNGFFPPSYDDLIHQPVSG